MLVMMITDPQCSKWISAYNFPLEKMTLSIQCPEHQGCLLEKRSKEVVSIAQHKTGDLGEIFQRRAAAWLPVGGHECPGGPRLSDCAGFGQRREGIPAARALRCAGQ